MRFIIMHKTNAHWESGAIPTPELIGRVGGLLGKLAKAGHLLAGEGLRASSEGVRVKFSAGTRSVINGPFERGNELPAAFSIRAHAVARRGHRVGVAPGQGAWRRRGRYPASHRAVGHRNRIPARRRSPRDATWCCERPPQRLKPVRRRSPEQRAELSRLDRRDLAQRTCTSSRRPCARAQGAGVTRTRATA